METKFQTSFIPKQPITEGATIRHSSGGSFFFLISFIIFMVSIATAGAAFFYNQLVDKTIADGNKQLAINENAFDPKTIEELGRLNDRINAADQLLHEHVAVSNFFPELERSTLKTVTFGNFAYKNSGADKISINMSGQARSYESIALQSRAFTDPSLRSIFHSPIFSGLNLDASGNVDFSFNMFLDPSVVSFYKNMKDSNAQGQTAAPDGALPPNTQ